MRQRPPATTFSTNRSRIRATGVTGVTIDMRMGPAANVGGKVSSGSAPAADSTVLLFPASRDLWLDATTLSRRLRAVRPAASGQYNLGNLPPGDYLIAAIPGDPSPSWQDLKELSALQTRAQALHVAPGETVLRDLSVLVR